MMQPCFVISSSHVAQFAILSIVLAGCTDTSTYTGPVAEKPTQTSRRLETESTQSEPIASPASVPATSPVLSPASPLPEELLRDIGKRKSSSSEHRERGADAFRNEDWKRAAQELQAALDTDQENDELRHGVAIARFRLHEWGMAATLLNRILARHPRDPAALELLGVVEVHQRRYKPAIRHLTEAIAVGRKSATVYGMRARAFFENGDFAEGFTDTDHALAAGSDDASLYVLRCSLAIRLKHRVEAEEALQNAEQRGTPPTTLEPLAAAIERLPLPSK